MRIHLLWILLISSVPVFAKDITLYACVIDGKTTLASTPSQNCDKLTEYRYKSTEEKQPNNTSSQRSIPIQKPEEIINYQAYDPRVGWAIANDYRDTLNDKCSYYQAQLKSLLATLGAQEPHEFNAGSQYIPTIDHGDVRTQQLNAAARHLQDQVNYYCH